MLHLTEFRTFIKNINIDLFMLNAIDKYLNESTKTLTQICGFTGTNGILIITKKSKCPFFTDGRYITQASMQLATQYFHVYDIRELHPKEWIKKNIKNSTTLGYYSHHFTLQDIRQYCGLCQLIPYSINSYSYQKQMITIHPMKYSGESSKSKCIRVSQSIKHKDTTLLLTDSNSISWLLNLRNNHNQYSPYIKGIALLYKQGNIDLFTVNLEYQTITYNLEDHIRMRDIRLLEQSIQNLLSIAIIPSSIPMNIISMIKSHQHLIEVQDPCMIYQAIKNHTEILGTINAHIKDGRAVTNFLYWCLNNIDTEIHAEEQLFKYRKKQPLFQQSSFATISAFHTNAAIIHYRANHKSNTLIQSDGLYLIDSGGQYLDGTTDVTRTIAIGNPTNQQIIDYTIVLKAHIAIANACFPKGTTGGELDILARIHLWKYGMDYPHSTGHGVGSYLSVHEGTYAISKGNQVILMPGMILSNEPGYYIPDNYGIRIENLMYVTHHQGIFLKFQQLTCVPYDRRLIDIKMLNAEEVIWINLYHQFVYKHLERYVQDRAWLQTICKAL
ncbi:aminopeptidase P family protein [Wolbachia endosymbiont of Howardula sp.]|uniref:aminopeptidase P family protein n=1 Tax=Wolbachia endosymbiont of Howardula sp. TaxID=2916816 RepID=UPI00217DD1AE|nr:aminopeptidase P family protein [Wolbachia endosymbiont of Howardula sp.]UWI83212.1 aminopeptidase P family protein [Wolbachia endosymbiont of Howardula sp.]